MWLLDTESRFEIFPDRGHLDDIKYFRARLSGRSTMPLEDGPLLFAELNAIETKITALIKDVETFMNANIQRILTEQEAEQRAARDAAFDGME